MFDAIFFDLDGTLIDTESLAVKAGLQAFSEVGFPVELSFLHQLVGRDEPSGAAIIAAAYPDLDRVLLQQRWGDGFRAGMADGLQMKAGARDLLARLSHPVAVVTSSGRASAHHKLGLVGLSDHFVEVVTLDDVTAAKPAPDPYLLAAARLAYRQRAAWCLKTAWRGQRLHIAPAAVWCRCLIWCLRKGAGRIIWPPVCWTARAPLD